MIFSAVARFIWVSLSHCFCRLHNFFVSNAWVSVSRFRINFIISCFSLYLFLLCPMWWRLRSPAYNACTRNIFKSIFVCMCASFCCFFFLLIFHIKCNRCDHKIMIRFPFSVGLCHFRPNWMHIRASAEECTSVRSFDSVQNVQSHLACYQTGFLLCYSYFCVYFWYSCRCFV